MPVWFMWFIFLYLCLQVLAAFPVIVKDKGARDRFITMVFAVSHLIMACLTLWFIAGGAK